MFVFPSVWPSKFTSSAKMGRELVCEKMNNMAKAAEFGELIVALLKAPHWFTTEFKEFFKVGPLDGATIQAKRLLHFAYDITNGAMSLKRIECALDMAKRHIGPGYDAAAMSLDQISLAFNAEKYFASTYDAGSCAEAAAVAHSTETAEISFFDTTAYHVDAFGRLLRVAVNTVCCIQRLHLGILKDQKTMNHAMLPKFTRTFSAKKKKIKSSERDEVWRNYIFDIAACWMVIHRFYASCKNEDPNEMIHALHKARIWSLTTGLAGSSSQLKVLEKHQSANLDKITKIGLFLHATLLRLWPIGLKALHTKGHGSACAVKRTIARISASVFVKSGEETKTDVPECGTATIVDNHWTFTMLQNAQLGIYDGHFGSRVEDLNHSVYAGALSEAITRTTSHLWAASVNYQVWQPLQAGLPELDEIEARIMPELVNEPLTLDELHEQGLVFRRSYFKNRESEENEEIDTIVSSLNLK